MSKWFRKLGLTLTILLLSMSVSVVYANENDSTSEYEHNYKMGQFHMIEGDYEVAIPFFVEAIENNPESYDAYVGLANSFLYSQNYEKLMYLTNDMAIKFPQSSDYLLLRAQAYSAFGQYDLAIKDLEDALVLAPQNYATHIIFGNTYRQMGEFPKAIKAYSNALISDENRESTYILLGEAYELNQEYKQALNCFEKSYELNSNSYYTCIKVAYIHTILGEFKDGIKYYEMASEINPTEELYVQIGGMYLLIDDIPASTVSFDKALGINPKNLVLMQNIAILYRDNELYDLAKAYLDRALTLDPKNIATINECGVIELRRNQNENALNLFEQALELDSENIDVLSNLATVYYRMGNNPEAYKYLEKTMQRNDEHEYSIELLEMIVNEEQDTSSYEKIVLTLLDSGDISVQLCKSFIETLISNGEIEDAVGYGKRFCELFSDYRFTVEIGGLFHDVNLNEEAISFYSIAEGYGNITVEELQKISTEVLGEGGLMQYVQINKHILEIDPQHVETMFNIGSVSYSGGRIEEAEAIMKDIVNNVKPYGPAYWLLGKINCTSGDFQTAMANYELAIQLDSDFVLQMIKFSKIQSGLVRDERVSQSGNGSLILNNRDIVDFENPNSEHLALLLEILGNHYESSQMYTDAIECNILSTIYGSQEALQNLVRIYDLRKDYENVINVYELIWENYPDQEEMVALKTQAYENLADYYYDIDEYDMAVNLYTDLLEYSPENIDLLYGISLSYYYMKDFDLALDYVDRVININPEMGKAFDLKGYICNKRNETSLAIENYNKAIELRHNSYEVLGNLYFDIGEFEKSIEMYKLFLETTEDKGKVLNWIGYSYYCIGKNEDAVKYYNKSLELDSSKYYVHMNLADAYYKLEDYERSIESCSNAMTLKPDYYKLHHRIGSSFSEIGNEEEATLHNSKAVELLEVLINEGDASSSERSYYAYCQYVVGNESLAVELFEAYLEESPNDYGLNYDYACVLSMSGEIDDALMYIENALKYKDGQDHRSFFETDKDLSNILNDQRFIDLLDRYYAMN